MTTTTTAKPYDFDEDSNYWISHLKIMKSAAGYYIGRDCYAEDEPLLLMPFDRDSNYFGTAMGWKCGDRCGSKGYRFCIGTSYSGLVWWKLYCRWH